MAKSKNNAAPPKAAPKQEDVSRKLAEGVSKANGVYEKYITPIRKAYEARRGEPLAEHTIANMAICMSNLQGEYNSAVGRRGIKEDTYTDAMATLQTHGFKIIAALLPSLIAEEIISVQAMDRRRGEAYFLNYLYGDSKSGVTAGDTMIGAKTGQQTNTFMYTSDYDNYQIGTGNGSETNFTGTLRYAPVVALSVVITAESDSTGDLIVTDDGSGNLIGDVGSGANSIDYATGEYDVTFSEAVSSAGTITIDYRYDWERMGVDGVPLIELDIDTVDLTAKDRIMRARWLVGAAYDLEKVHGRNAQSDLMSALVAEIRHEIDGEIMAGLLNSAETSGATAATFAADSPSTHLGKYEYYKEFAFTLESISEAIFQTTKRGAGNYIVCGRDIMALIAGLDDFEPSIKPGTKPPSGPHKRGTFRGRWTVYSNPFYAYNKSLVGYKGDSWLDSPAVYAPYMPAFSTPPVALDDLRWRSGTMTSYDWAILNSGMLASLTLV